jgi:hypothetical protein
VRSGGSLPLLVRSLENDKGAETDARQR